MIIFRERRGGATVLRIQGVVKLGELFPTGVEVFPLVPWYHW